MSQRDKHIQNSGILHLILPREEYYWHKTCFCTNYIPIIATLRNEKWIIPLIHQEFTSIPVFY